MGSLGELVDVVRKKRGAAVMAVLNTTPDSFFDGGRYEKHHSAAQKIDEMLEEGADIIDIGAESTRPGAQEISPTEQLERLGHAVEYAVECGAMVSVDTTSAVVAREALKLGARVVNDVSCLRDSELARVVAELEADLIIMHSRGSMTTMPGFSRYDGSYSDIVSDVMTEWNQARQAASSAGVAPEKIWFDPGLGFHKTAAQSHDLMRRLSEFASLNSRIVVGASRKSFIGSLDDSPADRRLGGSIAACLRALDAGAEILRVHDVHDVRQALLAYQEWAPKPSATRPSASPMSSGAIDA